MDKRGLPPQMSNFYCLPGRAGGTPMGIRTGDRYRAAISVVTDQVQSLWRRRIWAVTGIRICVVRR
jgi:hypothetical protein